MSPALTAARTGPRIGATVRVVFGYHAAARERQIAVVAALGAEAG
jgi:hypothetical protein